jgi:methyl-accepting chemotaxis protein
MEDNRSVVDALAGSREGISSGREIIDGVVSAFSAMLSDVQEIFGQVHRIEEATSAQMLQLREVMKQVQELSRLAHENFVSTQKTTLAAGNQKEEAKKMAAAVSSLTRLSEKMIESHSRFRLGEDA